MRIQCFRILDLLSAELALVLDQLFHLHLVDDSVDFEIIFIGFCSKNWAKNMCINLITIHLMLQIEMGEIY